MKQEKDNSENKIVIDKDNLADIIKYTDDALILLNKQYENPWVNLSLWSSNRILMFLSSLRYCFSDKQRKRFRSSAQKRANRKFINQWSDKKNIAFQDYIPSRTSLDIKKVPLKDMNSGLTGCNILVMDYRLPRSNISAGEKATFGLLQDLCSLGFNVTFVPEDMQKMQPYSQQISDLGVDVITKDDGYSSIADYIYQNGYNFDIFYFIRANVAEQALTAAEQISPFSPKIFHAPDISFLREIRAAQLNGNMDDLRKANEIKQHELEIMSRCDHVVVVSPTEASLLQELLPNQSISIFPALYANVETSVIPYNKRNDIFFLGGFAHAPNVDAVLWFCKEIWPLIHKELPHVNFHIIGAEAPNEIRELSNLAGVKFHGYIEELNSILQQYRVGIAPLTYGAGIKGKVAVTLGAGIPCVCTNVAAEGMGIINNVNGAIADNAKDFADAVIRIYNDENLWNTISQNGISLIKQKFSPIANKKALLHLLKSIRCLPLPLYQNYITNSTATSIPVDDSVDVTIILYGQVGWEQTEVCIKSIIESCDGSSIKYEIFLIVDEMNDYTLRANNIFQNINIINEPEDNGTSNADLISQQARGKYLLLLRKNTIVCLNWLETLVSKIDSDNTIGLVTSKIINKDSSIKNAGKLLLADGSVISYQEGGARFDTYASLSRQTNFASDTSAILRKNDFCGLSLKKIDEFILTGKINDLGKRIIYEPKSEVIYLEKSFPRDADIHSLDETDDILKIIASAEKNPSQKAIDRRKSGKLNVLYFSPFPSHPNNHGNQATIQAFGKKFQDMGHKVHFALLESNMYSKDDVHDMQSTWDSFDIIPNDVQLWSNGKNIDFDGWYEKELAEKMYFLCHHYDIDMVFFSYVFQSKMLDYVPSHILKVIDTHDKMGGRYDMLRKNNQPLEFFSCSYEEEGRYLNRADIVVARRSEEAKYFNGVMGRDATIVIPHIEDANFIEKDNISIKNVGIVASANRINLISVLDFLKAYSHVLAGKKSPITIHVAGQVNNMINDLSEEDRLFFKSKWVKMHGFVPDIKDFYNEVDIIVAPIMMGTGINVKTVQAMAYGMPILTTKCGIKGIETDDKMHTFNDLESLSIALLNIKNNGNELERLSLLSRSRYEKFIDEHLLNIVNLFKQVNVP